MAAGVDQPPLLAFVERHLATRAYLRGSLNIRAVLRVTGVVGHQPPDRAQIWKRGRKKTVALKFMVRSTALEVVRSMKAYGGKLSDAESCGN